MTSSSQRRLGVRRESWPLTATFTISRGARTTAEVVVVEIAAANAVGRGANAVGHGANAVGHGANAVGRGANVVGRGECVPYPRYGESPDGVVELIESVRGEVESGMTRAALQTALPAGAARNAIDCALWDLTAKQTGRPAWRLAGVPPPRTLTTAYTLSLDSPAAMAEAARAVATRPLLKLKLGADGDLERIRAVRDNAPGARLIVDANEGWSPATLTALAPALAEARVELVEQPLPAADDGALAAIDLPIPICADESCHDRATLDGLAARYDYVNIKLDKTGGLTEALAMAGAAEAAGLGIMVGCMIGTSLAMAPAALVGLRATFVDLDGPLLLAADRVPGIGYDGSEMDAPPPALWG